MCGRAHIRQRIRTSHLLAPVRGLGATRLALRVAAAWPAWVAQRAEVAPPKAVDAPLRGGRRPHHDAGQIVPIVAANLDASEEIGVAEVDQAAAEAVIAIVGRLGAPDVAQRVLKAGRAAIEATAADAVPIEHVNEHTR